ncbi:UNVERIFIED_CONTAM: Alpha/beta hydrolase domain-containing protein WAV2 [Sesamum latifolium]|uniref:Alpha/beta hydrolase domain-containing protein WAV2 n=1 Tax=Sesamum latifolium TaxID=2727402 RepID=A0AAW2VCA9_9LAMI
MVSYVSALLYGVGGIVMAGMALLVAFQEKLIYVPVLPGLSKSYPINLPAFASYTRTSGLHPPMASASTPGSSSPSPILEGGNHLKVTAISDGVGLKFQTLDCSCSLFSLTELSLQCNVFMLSYRGYGASAGFPSQHGITLDAQAALDHLVQRTDIDTSRIVVFGRSLGELLVL